MRALNCMLFLLFLIPRVGFGDFADGQAFNLSEKSIVPLANWEIRAGDSPEWRIHPGALSSWGPVVFWKAPPAGSGRGPCGRFWMRTAVTLHGEKDGTDLLAFFFIKIPSAFEVFWDGEFVAGNGRLGRDHLEEIPGKVRGFIRLPAEKMTAGRHQLALRVSNFHIQKKAHEFGIIFGYNSSLIDTLSQRKEENLLYMGLFLTASLFSLFLFLGGWRYFPAVFFSIFTIFQMLDNLWTYFMRTNILNVTLFYRLNPFFISANMLSFLPLNLFILWHLHIPRRKPLAWILSILTLLRLLTLFMFHWNLWQLDFVTAFVIFALIAQQYRQKKIGSGTALAGYGAFLGNWLFVVLIPLLPFFSFIDKPFVSLAPSSIFLVGLMGSVTLKMREQFRSLDALRFRSQRLEAELLKKSIQPHFIMNTLLSIKSFLGRDSSKAEKLIEALAEEFRLINRISAALEIPLNEELHLCRLHLELMGYRRAAQYTLICHGDCRDFFIPPMILHTLIENGLTHAFKPRENGVFRFSCKKEKRQTVYRLENDGSGLAGMMREEEAKIEEGMGMKYVRARLNEAYPGKWRLDYGVSHGRWFVQIEKGDA